MDKSTNTITPRRRREWKIENVNNINDGCKPFEVFNEDWAVNADGDLIGWGYYFIDCNRLAEEDWFIHMMSKDMPPCDKGKCCKRCNALNCNSRQCVNPQAIKRAQRDKLPWYLRDEIRR